MFCYFFTLMQTLSDEPWTITAPPWKWVLIIVYQLLSTLSIIQAERFQFQVRVIWSTFKSNRQRNKNSAEEEKHPGVNLICHLPSFWLATMFRSLRVNFDRVNGVELGTKVELSWINRNVLLTTMKTTSWLVDRRFFLDFQMDARITLLLCTHSATKSFHQAYACVCPWQ